MLLPLDGLHEVARFEPLDNRCAAEKPLAIAVLSGSNRYEPSQTVESSIRPICGDFQRNRLG